MQHELKQLPKNTVELTVELPVAELQPYLEEAARHLPEAQKIPGFRPGQVPYQIIEVRVGAMRVLEAALETIIRKSFARVVMGAALETLGSPKIDLVKCAPGNPLIFKATVTVLPRVTSLADYRALRLERRPVAVGKEEVDRFIHDLQTMRVREARANRSITKTDRAVIDLEISRNHVPVEGGSTKGYSILMDEPHYIPGFSEELIGMKEGEEKTFALPFPTNHYHKMLAGQPADFRVTVREIYTREVPALDDAFAQSLGRETLTELRALLETNLITEKKEKEEQRLEAEILEKIVAGSRFDDLPDLLVNEEGGRMRRELERGVAEQGIEWKAYLMQIKKTEADLKLDFAPQAVRRVKTALAVREIAKQEKIEMTDTEIDQELDRAAAYYKDDKEARERIYSPDYRDELTHLLKNRKTIARLKELIVK